MLWLQSCIDVSTGTSMICCEVNLQSNVEVTLVVQRCEFDVVVLRLWRHFKFDVAISTLQQRCQYNIHSTPWVKFTTQCWGNLGAILQFWRCGINATTTLFIGCRRCDLLIMLSQRCVFVGHGHVTPRLVTWSTFRKSKANLFSWPCLTYVKIWSHFQID